MRTAVILSVVGALWGADAFAACRITDPTGSPPELQELQTTGPALDLCEPAAQAYNVAEVSVTVGFLMMLVPRDYSWSGESFRVSVCEEIKHRIPRGEFVFLSVVTQESLIRANGSHQWEGDPDEVTYCHS